MICEVKKKKKGQATELVYSQKKRLEEDTTKC